MMVMTITSTRMAASYRVSKKTVLIASTVAGMIQAKKCYVLKAKATDWTLDGFVVGTIFNQESRS